VTQRQLAARVAISVQYVQRVEGGKQNLTIATCVKFANALGVEPARLLGAVEGR
jgi:transcriptional regulator with XRE-family HTH domain